MRAATAAASTPAWPPPTTITSNFAFCMFHVKQSYFPNTEARKNFAQYFFDLNATGNST